MSVASFCSSLPAGPYGFKDGRGTRDMVRMPDIVRLTAKPPAQACRLTRWSKYHCAAVAPISPLSPSSIAVDIPTNFSPPPPPMVVDDDEIDVNLSPFLITYKSRVKRIDRFNGNGYVPASFDSSTGVNSKDVIVNPVTKLSVRIYLPKVAESPAKKLPVLVYFHGGAFIVEDTASPPYHNYLNRLAAKAGILIVSVNYRLAPEHRLPAAYDDCMEALKWVVSHSTNRREPGVPSIVTSGSKPEPWIVDHGDFDHLFLSGDSAGGNITHNLAIRADAPENIEGIALVHPYFFGSMPTKNEAKDKDSLSLHNKLWPFIAPKDSEGMDDPRVNPWGPNAKSLKELKCQRVVVFVAGDDFHADRGRMYVDKLKESGWGKESPACHDHPDVNHVFHLSVDESNPTHLEADEKMMTQLVAFYKGETVI